MRHRSFSSKAAGVDGTADGRHFDADEPLTPSTGQRPLVGSPQHSDGRGRVGVARYELLNTWLDAFTLETLLSEIDFASGRRYVIGNHNMNSLTLLRKSPGFRAFYDRADAIFVDGMAVVAVARLLGVPLGRHHRLGVLDWISPFCSLAERRGWRVVHVGGTEEGSNRARARLQALHPHLRLTTVPGFFDVRRGSGENDEALARVRDAKPDVLLVGMGMPRQEIWIEENLDRLPGCPIITVGGVLSYLAGERPTCPRFVGQLGFEWLFRLATEPRRLWRRYLVEPLPLLALVVRHVVRSRVLPRRPQPPRNQLGQR